MHICTATVTLLFNILVFVSLSSLYLWLSPLSFSHFLSHLTITYQLSHISLDQLSQITVAFFFPSFLVELKATVIVIVGVGQWAISGDCRSVLLGVFFFLLVFFFFFLWLDASVDLVAQWEVEGWVDDGGCLMMVAMWVVLGLWERWQC